MYLYSVAVGNSNQSDAVYVNRDGTQHRPHIVLHDAYIGQYFNHFEISIHTPRLILISH